jgi:two-component system sensor histidine kinase MtrB
MILNDQGEVLAHPDEKEVAQRRDLRRIFQQLPLFASSGVRSGTKEISVDDVPQLVAYARVTPSIAVLQTMDKDRVFAAAAPLVTNAIIAASIVAVIAVLVALLLSGTIIRPLRSMMRQVEAIGRGEFGVAVQAETSGSIGSLARQLNEMSAALKARDEEVSLMQRQVLRAERVNTAGRMISAIAKELNDPLDTCFSLSTECQRLEPGDMKIRENNVRIAQEANRAANILQNLSRVGQGEERSSADSARSIELDLLISDVVVSSGALLRQRKLEVETDLQTTKAVEVKPDELRSLLLDLLLFVADHAKPDIPVKVSLQQQGAEAIIGLSFAGPSWSEEQRRQLANPYDSACHGEGSLMLAVSALVLEDHGGRLEVDEAEGRNRLRLFIPIGSKRRRATMELLEAADV